MAFGTSTSRDSKRSAVHVHLAVSDLIEPSPGQGVVTSCQLSRNSEIILVGVNGIGVLGHVSCLISSRATALDRLDHFPHRVLVRLNIGGDRDLARTTTMDSAANERELLFASLGVDVACTFSIVGPRSHLAREIRSIREEWAVVEA